MIEYSVVSLVAVYEKWRLSSASYTTIPTLSSTWLRSCNFHMYDCMIVIDLCVF